jgi:predicted esterase
MRSKDSPTEERGEFLIRGEREPLLASERVSVAGLLIGDVLVRKVEKPGRVFLLLHGYTQTGEKMLSRLELMISRLEVGPNALIIAPNAPYPIPERKPEGWKAGFSWYFYDFSTDEYFIDMENAMTYLQGLIDHYGLQGIPTTVIGFSQGGYLAPIFAKRCPQVDHVIGIGCEFLPDEIQCNVGDPVSFRVDQVHGADDPVVSAENSLNSHQILVSRGAKGTFEMVPEEGHRLSLKVLERVKKLLAGF